MYQLTKEQDGVIDLETGQHVPIGSPEYQEYVAWVLQGNEALPVDNSEAKAGRSTAIQYFASKPAAIAFMRLTPEEQEAQIEAMTLAQLKTVVKYLAVAVSALVKKHHYI
jgi:hypothetical protein